MTDKRDARPCTDHVYQCYKCGAGDRFYGLRLDSWDDHPDEPSLVEHFPKVANAIDEASLMRELLQEWVALYADGSTVSYSDNCTKMKQAKTLLEATDD